MQTRMYKCSFCEIHSDSLFEILERLRFTFTPNGSRELVPRDQVFPLIVVFCILLLLKNKQFYASVISKNCSGQFFSACFLF